VTAAARLRWHELLSTLPEAPAVEPPTPSARLHDLLYPALVRSIAERPPLGRLFPEAQRYAITLRERPGDIVRIGTAAVNLVYCFTTNPTGKPYWLLDGGAVVAEGDLGEIVDLLEQRAVAAVSASKDDG